MRKRKQKGLRIFCTWCKEYIEVSDAKQFRDQGHRDKSVESMPFLRPDYGRSTRRYDRAMKKKEVVKS